MKSEENAHTHTHTYIQGYLRSQTNPKLQHDNNNKQKKT